MLIGGVGRLGNCEPVESLHALNNQLPIGLELQAACRMIIILYSMHMHAVTKGVASSPGPLRGGERAWYTLSARAPLPLRILGVWILSYTCPFTNPCTCPCSQFVAGHLPFEPHSDSVIQLQEYQLCEISSPMWPSSDHEKYRC